MLLVPSLVALVILVATYPPGPFGRSLSGLLDSVPGFGNPVWEFLYDLLAAWTVALLATALLSRRGFVLAQALAAFALAAAVTFVSARIATGDWPELVDLVRRGANAPSFPDVRIAETAAVLLTISPRLVRPVQRACRWLLLLGFVGALFVDNATPSGVAAGFLIGVIAAAVIRLAFGTSVGRPGLDAVAAALDELGIEAGGLEFEPRQVAEVVAVRARDAEGRPLSVEAYGRDAYDNQLLEKLWRTLWYQDGVPACGSTRARWRSTRRSSRCSRQRRSPDPRGSPRRDDEGRQCAARAPRRRPSARIARGRGDRRRRPHRQLAGARTSPRCPHRAPPHRYAHGRAAERRGRPRRLRRRNGGRTADHRLTDRAQLLVTTAAVAGSDRALASSRRLDRGGRRRRAPSVPAAGRATRVARQATKEEGSTSTTCATGPRPWSGRRRRASSDSARVTWGTLIQAALLLLAGLAVLLFATGIDYDQLWSSLEDATGGWILSASSSPSSRASPRRPRRSAPSPPTCASGRSTGCSSRRAI